MHLLGSKIGVQIVIRYYDQVAGRFLSEDPVLTDNNTGASFNRYVYANNNPYRFIDPDGRNPRLQAQSLATLKDIWHKIFGADKAPTKIPVDTKIEVGAAHGVGIEIEHSLATGSESISFLPAAEGAFGGLLFSLEQPLEAKFAKSESPMSIKGGVDYKVGYIAVAGVEAEVDPAGTLGVTPKAGLGAGGLAKFSPSIKFFSWGKKEDDKPVKTTKDLEGK